MAELNVDIDAPCRSAVSLSGARVDTFAIAAIVSALSLLHTGFVFGIENNLFHLPIVAGLYDEPQYRDDAFIQSLRYFASGVWLLLGNAEKHFGDVQALFLVLDYLSRLLSFVGFLCCASLVGVVERRDKVIFALVVCFISFLDGDSHAGAGGLFLRYFTHSEIANGTVLLAIYFAAKGRFTAATLALGVTFFTNVFIAVWLAPLLLAIAVVLLAKQETDIATICVRVSAGIVLCIPFAWPVIHSIVSNPEFGSPIDFDFATFLRQYYPVHVLISSIPASDIVALAGVAAIGAVALWRLGPRAAELRVAYVGVMFVYAVGIVLPHMTGSPLLLNLHLLRSSTIIHLLAGLAAAALVVNWFRAESVTSFLLAALLLLTLSLHGVALWLAIPIMLIPVVLPAAQDSAPAYLRTIGYVVLAVVVLIVWPYSFWQNFTFNSMFADAVAEWRDVGEWARRSTSPTAVFLVPPRPRDDAILPSNAPDIALSRTAVFEFTSHRRVFVDFKRGAAVMWMPSYYPVWRSRMIETERLGSLAERIEYASRHGIAYVVDRCEPTANDGVIFRTRRLCVIPAGRQM